MNPIIVYAPVLCLEPLREHLLTQFPDIALEFKILNGFSIATLNENGVLIERTPFGEACVDPLVPAIYEEMRKWVLIHRIRFNVVPPPREKRPAPPSPDVVSSDMELIGQLTFAV